MSSINYIREILFPELVPCAYILLSNVLRALPIPIYPSVKFDYYHIDLLHDVSLRSASNKMDAMNLAIVICPNLLKGSNPARDVAMVSVPGTPAFSDRPSSDGNGRNSQGERSATLGMVVAHCIRRYYEVFDEVMDSSEAVPAWRAPHADNVPYILALGSLEQSMYVLSNEGEEEEDLDDDKLQRRVSPPLSGVGASSASSNPVTSSTLPPPKRHKKSLSSGSNSEINSTTRSMHTLIGETNGSIRIGDVPNPTYGRAKSTISIENGGASGNESGTTKGSISVGRGTRKGSGASVEAVGVTAGGFFSAPDDTPLVPDGKGGWKKS